MLIFCFGRVCSGQRHCSCVILFWIFLVFIVELWRDMIAFNWKCFAGMQFRFGLATCTRSLHWWLRYEFNELRPAYHIRRMLYGSVLCILFKMLSKRNGTTYVCCSECSFVRNWCKLRILEPQLTIDDRNVLQKTIFWHATNKDGTNGNYFFGARDWEIRNWKMPWPSP